MSPSSIARFARIIPIICLCIPGHDAFSRPRFFEPPTALTGRLFVPKSDLDVRTGLLKQHEAQLETAGESLTIMCVGESGTGKSTLIANIFTAPITRTSESRSSDPASGPTLSIVESQLSLDCEGIPLKIKIVDTPGAQNDSLRSALQR